MQEDRQQKKEEAKKRTDKEELIFKKFKCRVPLFGERSDFDLTSPVTSARSQWIGVYGTIIRPCNEHVCLSAWL